LEVVVRVTDGDKSHLDDQQRTELRLDYQQTMQYIQMLTNIRFLPLTLLPGLTGAAVTILTRFDNPRTALAVGLMGLFVSVMIILYDIQNTALHDAAVYRAKSIESSLRLPPFTKHKQAGGLFNESPQRIAVAQRRQTKNPLVVRNKNIVAVVYGVVIGGWVHVIVHASTRSLPTGWQPSEIVTDLVSLLAAVVVVALTVLRLPRIVEHNEPEPLDEHSET
jgi:hypothetical protein